MLLQSRHQNTNANQVASSTARRLHKWRTLLLHCSWARLSDAVHVHCMLLEAAGRSIARSAAINALHFNWQPIAQVLPQLRHWQHW